MNEMTMPKPAASRPAPRRKLSLPTFSAILERFRSDMSPEERRERLIRAVERDRVLAERHRDGNVPLVGVYFDPLFMPYVYK